MSNFQEGKLRLRVAELFRYLQKPSFDEYYRLKTEGLQHEFAPDQLVKELLAKTRSSDKAGALLGPKETVKAIWTAVHAQGGTHTGTKITAFCLDHIATAVSRTNSPFSLLNGKVSKGFTIAEGALDPGIQYVGLQKVPTDSAEGPRYFHLSFFAKMNGSDNAGPVYVSLCWLPQEQQWGLIRLIADRWVGITTVF